MKHILVCLILAAAVVPTFGGQKKTKTSTVACPASAKAACADTTAAAKASCPDAKMEVKAEVKDASACATQASASSCCSSSKVAKKVKRSGSAKGAYMAMR